MKYFLTLVFFLIPLAWSTRVNANYVTAKTFLLYLFSSIALFAVSDAFKLKKIPKFLWISLLLTLAYQVGFYAFDFSYHNALFSFKYLSLVFLTLYFYSLDISVADFLKKNYFLIPCVFGLIFLLTGKELAAQWEQTGSLKYTVLSTFGNVNMLAEFLVLSLPLLFFWSRAEDKIYRAIKLVILGCTVLLLLYTNSRSAWLGFGLWLAVKIYMRLTKKEMVTLALAVGLFLFARNVLVDAGTLLIKDENVAVRSVLYRSALDMMVANPWGIEPGRYVSDMIPFYQVHYPLLNEFSYFDQPHSDILKWGVQFGWIFFFLSLAALGALAFYSFKSFWANARVPEEKSGYATVFFETLLVLSPELAFQFPFENPATILVVAFVLGLYLSSFETVKTIDISKARVLLCALGVAGIINSFFFISSVYLESTRPKSAEMMSFDCALYPVNFKACFWKQLNFIDNKNFGAFRATYREDMNVYPLYIDYLRLLPSYYSAVGEGKKACEALMIYNFLYVNQKSFAKETLQSCTRFSAPFDFKNTAGFKDNYVRWLNH